VPVLARRTSLLLAAAVLLATACDRDRDLAEACPGDTIAALAFTGARDLAPAPDPVDGVVAPACEPALGFDEEIAFTAILSGDARTGSAAACPGRERADVFYGSRAGTAIVVSTSLTDGAVLGACGPSCAARADMFLTGTLDTAAGPATAFSGTWVERLWPLAGGECGGCTLPCDARYDVRGAPAP
jgi:hypothetical protein